MLVGPHLHEQVEVFNAFNVADAASSGASGATTQGNSISLFNELDGRMITFFINTVTASGKTLTVEVEESADNSTFTTIKKISDSTSAISFVTTDNTQEFFMGSIPFAYLQSTTKYLRLIIKSTSGASGGGAAATAVISGLYNGPGSATDKFFSDTVFAAAGVPTN